MLIDKQTVLYIHILVFCRKQDCHLTSWQSVQITMKSLHLQGRLENMCMLSRFNCLDIACVLSESADSRYMRTYLWKLTYHVLYWYRTPPPPPPPSCGVCTKRTIILVLPAEISFCHTLIARRCTRRSRRYSRRPWCMPVLRGQTYGARESPGGVLGLAGK